MLSPIKRTGIGYYELENGQIIDKGLYELATFLDRQIQILQELIVGHNASSTADKENQNNNRGDFGLSVEPAVHKEGL
jgi:hypothetical protein